MRAPLVVMIAAAAVAGYAAGAWSLPPRPSPRAAIAVAWIPTSTPDLRTPIPTPAPAASSAAPPTTTLPVVPATPDPTASPSPPLSWPLVPRTPAPRPVPVPTTAPADPDVVYVARAKATPLAVTVAGAAEGRSPSDRIYSRLHALPKAHAPVGAMNLAARTAASLVAVTVEGDGSVVLEYALVGGTWGFGSQEDLRLLMQQIVFTATEEKDVRFVTLRRYGGGPVPIRPAEQWTFGREMSRDALVTWPK